MPSGDPRESYSRPLIPVVLSFICGIVTGLYLPDVPGTLFALCACFISCIFLAWRQKMLCLLPLMLFFLLGYCSIQYRVAPRLPANHISSFADDNLWHIIGTVDSQPRYIGDRTRFTLRVRSLARKQRYYPVTGRIQLNVRGNIADISAGDSIACLARVSKIRNFNNPGSFNYRRYLAFRGILASAFVSNENHLVRLNTRNALWFRSHLNRWRQAVSSLIDMAARGQPAGLLKALIIGNRSEVAGQTRRLFNLIGVAHLLAISGLHIGMVATVAFFLFRLLLARSERILLSAWVTRGAALLSVLPVLFYGFLAGGSPATQRAVIMVMVLLTALVFEHEHEPINTLALAALIILVIRPTALFEISFQLSFIAVFAILYTLKHLPLASKLRKGSPTALKRLALFLLVSATAILGTLPITLYYFNQTSIIGLISNCFMVPLIGFVVVPMGLTAVLFLPIFPTAALWIMKTAAITVQGGLAVAGLLSRCPVASVKTVTPSLFEIALYFALAWALFNLKRTRLSRVVVVVIVVMASADVAYWVSQGRGSKELRMTILDVGHGSSALLQLPGGRCMLVDGGGFYDNRFDVGARVVAPFLWRKKIATVETIVLSHADPNHLNGLLFIAKHFNVKQVWMNQQYVPIKSYEDFLNLISEKNIQVVPLEDLLKPRTINGVRFQVLYPPRDFLERSRQDAWRKINNNSLVLKVSFRKVSFLLPGDIEAQAENELVYLAGDKLKSDVLLVPHYGGNTSSTPEFVEHVDPAIAVISAGRKNRFEFPHPNVLSRYRARGCRIFRTDRNGAVTISTDGTDIRVKPFLSQQACRWSAEGRLQQ